MNNKINPSNIQQLKFIIQELCKKESFVHHQWFLEYHLEIVELLALELLQYYPSADKSIVITLVWLHDYAKITNQDKKNSSYKEVTKLLLELNFEKDQIDEIVISLKAIDSKDIVLIKDSSIEIQIVSSADAASHFVGPFHSIWLYENPNVTINKLMESNIKKIHKDLHRKLCLPEALRFVNNRLNLIKELNGEIPSQLITPPSINS